MARNMAQCEGFDSPALLFYLLGQSMIQLVPRPNVIFNKECRGYFTHVVISFHMETDGQTECHHFCTEQAIEETKRNAKYYEDSIVKVVTLAEYILDGHAYISVSSS